ncbi:MAG: (d)CMP kinase [Pseudobdellovibrionaceae bacterium]
MVITIDGPAASGKSSVSRELARRLGWRWVSTGAFYRGLAYVALQKKIDLEDDHALEVLAQSSIWSVQMSDEKTVVLFDGNDVTEDIGQEAVGSCASKISQFPKVRQALLDLQRHCSDGPLGLIAEGRDCGTVVFPQAPVKVFLTASSELRAARRAAEQGLDAAQTIEAQKLRDQQDSTRAVAPMQVADQALVVDTSALDFHGVVSQVENHIKKSLNL